MIRSLLLIIALALLLPGAAHCFDEVQSRLLEGYGLPLRWHNVESSPLLMDGDDPVDDNSSPRHLLKLSPGQSATVWLPAWEMLRLDAQSDTLAATDLEVSFSSGGALFRLDAGIPANDSRALLFAPSSPAPLLARITRPRRHTSPLAVAAYVSFRDHLGEIAPYRQPVELPLERIMLPRPGLPGEETFWSIPADQTIAIALKGPARVAFENHLVYPPQESRRSFIYRVESDLDGRHQQVMEFETGPEIEPARHDGRQRHFLGRRRTGYINVPPGDVTLHLKPTVALYGRLLVQERPDYLFPQLNAPSPTAAAVTESGFPASHSGSFAGLGEQALADVVEKRDPSPVSLQRAALMTARDNRRRDGGVAGAALLRNEGMRRPDYPDIRERAEEFAGFHTFYRDLFPLTGDPALSAVFRWFLPTRLAEPDAHPFGMAVGEQQSGELVRMLAGGTFVNAPDAISALRYRLPERFAPTLLRIAAPKDSLREGDELFIQFDSRPPQKFAVYKPPALPDGTVPLQPAEAGLIMLAEQHGSPWPLTLSGAFSGISPPGPLLAAATAELPLPGTVREIRLWKNGEQGGQLPVALQYRVSAPYRMAESEFLAATAAIGKEAAPLKTFSALLPPESHPPDKAPSILSSDDNAVTARVELARERLPLARLIRSLERSFSATVAPSATAVPASGRITAASAADAVSKAQKAEKRGEWLNAIEAWSIPAAHGDASVRREGIFGQIEALLKLNEDFLAEHRLKGLFLHGEDEETRSMAMTTLERQYAAGNNTDALLALRAAAFTQSRSAASLRALGMTLLESGERELALQAFLMLDPPERPRDAMLQASLRLGWWQTFAQLLRAGGTAQEHSLWEGLRAMSEGRFAEAAERLAQGGAEGKAQAMRMEEGLRIRDALAGNDRETRLKAISAWEKWQSGHAGPKVWESEMGSMAAGAGTAQLVNKARDSWFHAFRATAAQPVTMRLAGPVRIRVEARPLHPAGSRIPLDGWLQVRDGEKLYLQPIIRNMPAQGLDMPGDTARAAGFKVEREINLGPGIHELQVSGGTLELLVRVSALRPALPETPLPTITPETLCAAVAGLYLPPPSVDAIKPVPEKERITLVSRHGTHEARQLPYTRHDILNDVQRQADWLTSAGACDLTPLAALRPPPVPDSDERSALLAGRGDLAALFETASDSGNQDVMHRAVLMLWAAEQKTEFHLPALSMLRAVSAAHPGSPGLSPIIERLFRRGSWIPVTAIASGAGLRSVEVAGWQPETPLLRIRRALLAPTADNERMLADTGRMVFSMVNRSTSFLDITLAAEELAYLIPQTLTASWQLDNGMPQRLTLRAGAPPATVSLTIPPGEHAVRIAIEERFADQFLRVGLKERPAEPVPKGEPQGMAAGKLERPYQVATRREPIRIRMDGPALLRIDELRDGIVTVTYRMVAAGAQEIVIAPEADRNEGLYRFFTHALVAEKPFVPVRYAEITQTPVPAPSVVIASNRPPAGARFSDDFTPGRQEDGTWSVTGAFARRKPPQETGAQELKPEQFMEASATHRYFNGERRYYESGGLIRLREHGDPTFGMRARLTQLPLYAPFTWSLGASLYLQNQAQNALLPLSGSPEWATAVQGSLYQQREMTPLTWHRPAVSMFGRLLSRSSLGRNDIRRLDQDVFTSYKAEHLNGIAVSDSIIHRPWLDALFQASLTLASNELEDYLTPDHLAIAMEWKQLLGAFQANANLRSALYFPDKDRNSATSRNKLGIELIYNRWLDNLDRLELNAGMDLHLESSDLTGMFSLTWHFGNGRGLRDFLPGEIDFRDLRRRMIPTSRNNGIFYDTN